MEGDGNELSHSYPFPLPMLILQLHGLECWTFVVDSRPRQELRLALPNHGRRRDGQPWNEGDTNPSPHPLDNPIPSLQSPIRFADDCDSDDDERKPSHQEHGLPEMAMTKIQKIDVTLQNKLRNLSKMPKYDDHLYNELMAMTQGSDRMQTAFLETPKFDKMKRSHFNSASECVKEYQRQYHMLAGFKAAPHPAQVLSEVLQSLELEVKKAQLIPAPMTATRWMGVA
ncbi:hypothetical protein N7501_006005 [Penicillium viridicatum]|nr:hypothetical protein N7501_006005 [Penicillium viridicatum]